MKRLFACAVAGCLIASAFSSADAARKKSTTSDGQQSLRIPAVRVSTSTKSTHKPLAAPKLPTPGKKTLTPVPEDPYGPIYRPPVLPPDPVVAPASHLVVPPTPKKPRTTYRPELPPDPQIVQPPVVVPPVVDQPVVGEQPVIIDYEPLAEAPTIQMFEKVRYTGKRKVAPNAVTKLVIIRDPSQPKRTAPTCRNCVAIEICVPPCACESIKANKAENVVRYNYGKYGVEVRIKKGRVVVQYHARARE